LKYFSKYIFKDTYNWAEKLAEYLNDNNILYDFVYIDENDWIEKIDKYDVVIWKTAFMGVKSSQILKEKVFFMQEIMQKRVFPNYNTVWHFDSKIAQSYLLRYKKIKTPETFVSFDYNNILNNIDLFKYPVVIKETNGAGSSSVSLVKSPKHLVKYVNKRFLWENIFSRKLSSRLFDRFGQIYLQEFIPNNNSDLRITIIGHKYAFGFWRKNRHGDFRASGSGRLDYVTDVPPQIIKYCSQISKSNNFDSMAYDILFRNGEFMVVEMSYGYSDKAIYNSNGYYILDENGDIKSFEKGHYWPQQLWIKWILESCCLK